MKAAKVVTEMPSDADRENGEARKVREVRTKPSVLPALAGGGGALLMLAAAAVLLLGIKPGDLAVHRLSAALFGPVESPPPIGDDLVLVPEQVRYCLNEAVRLRTLGEQGLPARLRSYHRLAVENFNRRCGGYRAPEDVIAELQREAAENGTRLRQEAEDRVRAWTALADEKPRQIRDGDPIAMGLERLDLRDRRHARLVQGRLSMLGHYLDKVDGLWGPKSREALSRFKKDQHLAANAEWNMVTQRRLFASQRSE